MKPVVVTGWIVRFLAIATLTLLGQSGARAESSPAPAIPSATRTAINAALQAAANALSDAKNTAGLPFKRGWYSRQFTKVDDSTYQASFTRQTVKDDALVSERFVYTVKKDAAGKWGIVKEDPVDTFDKMYRAPLGDEKFEKFERFSFEREGMKITATGGTVYEDSFMGKTDEFVIAAADLKYEYTPPKGAGAYGQSYANFKKDYSSDLAFTPERLVIYCTAAECEDIRAKSFTGLTDSTFAEMADPVKHRYQEFHADVEKARKENAFSGFRLAPYPDRRVWVVSLGKKAIDEHAISLEFDSYEPKEVGFSVSHLGASYTGWRPVFRYYSKETIESGVSPYDLERRDDAEGRFYGLESVVGTINMAIDEPETLTADITFAIKLKKDTDGIQFQIARIRPIGTDRQETKNPRMTVHAAQLEDGTELTAIRTGPFSGLLVLPKHAHAGDVVKVRMQFENKDSIYNLTPSFSYVDRGGWLPFVRFGDTIDSFDLTVRVPEKYEVLGIGKEVYQKKENGLTVARFKSPSPVEFPSIVFGDYYEDKPDHVPTKSDGTPIPVRIFLDRISMSDWEIPVKNLKPIAAEAAVALDMYKEIYGVDYLYAKLDLVNDAFGGFYGQSPSSIVYLGSPVFKGRGLMGAAYGASMANFYRSVVAHEVAHQWWGSLISNANDGNYWFVESLAEYSAALFVEKVYGKDAYRDKVAEWRRTILATDMNHSVQDASTLASPDGSSYQAAVYDQGPYAFHILRSTFGDEKFFAFLKDLANTLKGKEIVSRDIQISMEKSFGGNMEWFFDQWIRGIGIPQYSFFYDVRRTEDGKYIVSGKVRQRVLSGTKKNVMEGVYYRGVVPITVIGSGKHEYPVRIKVEGPETPFQFKVPEEPQDVEFNKNGDMLAYDVLVNKSW